MAAENAFTLEKKALGKIHKAELIEKLAVDHCLVTLGQALAIVSLLDEIIEKLIAIVVETISADRGSVFLADPKTQELYASINLGQSKREIRFFDTTGVAGHVFHSGQAEIISNTAKCSYFNPEIDTKTGYKTHSILCVPIIGNKNRVIGVLQCLNKLQGKFTQEELNLTQKMVNFAAQAIEQAVERQDILEEQRKEQQFQSTIVNIASEINLSILLNKVMREITELLNAERSTLFLNDSKSNELFSELGQGLDSFQIRIPNNQGIAGAVFQTGETINIPHAYADMRFNPSMDKKTGYFTRNILCSPIVNKKGERIGVTQVLNKRGGIFTHADETRLAGFTSQIAIALENAKLFDDVQTIKNYNEIMLESMSNAVITIDAEGLIQTCNKAGFTLLKMDMATLKNQPLARLFEGENAFVLDLVRLTQQEQKPNYVLDQSLNIQGDSRSVNISTLPLISGKQENLGSLIMFEDISKEKRLRSTMSRYMNPTLANQLIESGELVLGGKTDIGTVLFSDIRSFTTVSEALGAEGTVNMLNNYFTLMVDCISEEDGMLDKFIGDAIMALFGVPVKHEDDPDRAVRCAINMIKLLQEFNQSRSQHNMPAIDIGIGINTDRIMTGNIGSPKRMEFTAIGDGVNLASRLESACKQYGAHIIISENTMSRLKGTYRNRKIDQVIVKGKTEAVSIYEILDFHDAESFPNIMEALNFFQSGIEYYTIGQFKDAIKMFKNTLNLNPKDYLSQVYIERCHQLQKHTPEDWNGVWVMSSK